jgi:hypothetical protein
MCAVSCERFFKGTFLKVNLGFSEINFVNSNKELVTIHDEKMKKIIDKIGPPKFKYHTNKATMKKINRRIFNLFIRLKKSSFPHLRKGPKIIPITSGKIIGASIELKNGAPTEILVLKITPENSGYTVPSKIVKLSVSINILFNDIAPSFEIRLMLFFLGKKLPLLM